MKLIDKKLFNDEDQEVLVQVGRYLFSLKLKTEVTIDTLSKMLDDPHYVIKLLEQPSRGEN